MGRWYKRYGADFVAGTMALTLEQKGAYSLCLDLIYDRGGPIPDDARWLAGVCGVSLRKWASLRKALIAAGKLKATDGTLMNDRAERMIAAANDTSRSHAENGAKGGRKRAENLSKTVRNEAENEPQPKQNNDLDLAGLNHSRSQYLDKSSSRARELPLDRLCRIMGVDQAKLPAGFQRFGGAFAGWLDRGCDPERHIWPTIERVVARGNAITTPKYFERAILEARDSAQSTAQRPDDWSTRVAAYCVEPASWDRSRWGPTPDEPGCQAPPHLLTERAA